MIVGSLITDVNSNAVNGRSEAKPSNEGPATPRQFKALDLFCGAGGASMGLYRAGFDVTGVDIKPQPRYPFKFTQADALEFPLEGFDFIWAGPVCKKWTIAKTIHNSGERWPDQIAPIRRRLVASNAAWVIENVPGSPLRNPLRLCGTMFGLRVYRHRLFETNFHFLTPFHACDDGTTNASRGLSTGGPYVCVAGHNFLVHEGREAMGIDWMVGAELSQAIPPAYSEFIGKQAIQFLSTVEVSS